MLGLFLGGEGGLFLIPASVPRLERKRNVLFNDALNTFIFTGMLCGVGHMVKDHSDSEGGNPLPPLGYSFRLTARVLLYVPIAP